MAGPVASTAAPGLRGALAVESDGVRVFGGIELGGTNTTWGLGDEDLAPIAAGTFPTGDPGPTIDAAIAAIHAAAARAGAGAGAGGTEPAALGIGAFGPLDLGRGTILRSPKEGWSGTDLRALARERIRAPVAIDTDVNAAALGERHAGAARGAGDFIYLTVGTGIGGGAGAGGRLLYGDGHPEMGHMRVPRHDGDLRAPGFAGICPFHRDCLEGMACGPAIAARFGAPPETFDAGHPAWEREAHYLGLAIANLVHTLRPERIIAGGGVMDAPGLRERTRRAALAAIGSYLDVGDGAQLVLAPGLGDLAGLVGAFALARVAADAIHPSTRGGST